VGQAATDPKPEQRYPNQNDGNDDSPLKYKGIGSGFDCIS